MTARAILMIPSGYMLDLAPVSHWVDAFKRFARATPTEVMLPAVGFSGPLFDSAVQPVPEVFSVDNTLLSWVRDSRELLGPEGVVWASILVDGQFLDSEGLFLRDQYDQVNSQICLSNPVVQDILHDLIREIIDTGVDGIMLDVTNAYPNSGATGMIDISGSCFCNYCVDGLRLQGCSEPREAFIGERGLLRFVLKVKSEGTAHIDPPQAWLDGRNAKALAATAVARGFVEDKEDKDTILSDAERLLKYFGARVRLTAETIRAVFGPARDAGRRTAVVLGSCDADLSQLVTLQSLSAASAADEYWLPDAPPKAGMEGSWRAVQTLAARSTYYFNAFFEAVETAQQMWNTLGPDRYLAILQQRSKQLAANRFSPGAAYAAQKYKQYDGFAGIPIGTDDHLQIIRKLTSRVVGQTLPEEVLQQFEILNPDKRDKRAVV